MSDYDLIAFDMDGTLLNSEKQISKDTLDMISLAEANGKVVCLSTGRCMPELNEYIPNIPGLRYIIGDSGTFIRDLKTGKNIFSHPMPLEVSAELVRRVRESGEDLMLHIHSELSVAQRSHVANMSDYNMGVYQTMFERICTMPENIIDFYMSAPFASNKINLYCREAGQRDRMCAMLSDLDIEPVYAEACSLEFTPAGTSKGKGLEYLCNYLAVPIERSIAVGDADNDLEILSCAGLAVAMGNAKDNVKALADVIVADNDSDGCAEAIRRFLL
ncbi:MAG: HAD family hydrolase [Eubacteriales bacterium]|nr:HAD family hydrolase [Eubacteriales bacterium]